MLGAYLLRRLVSAVPTMWAVVTLTFLAVYLLPGDAAQMLLSESNATAAEIEERRQELGLDDNPFLQYGRYCWKLLHGDLGISLFTGRPVTKTVLEQLPATLNLAGAALLVTVGIGIPLGILAALYRGTWIDIIVTSLTTVGISTPVFWSGLLAIWLFALVLRWFPATGQGGVRYLVLPAMVLGLSSAGAVARVIRASLVDVLNKQFLLAAQSRGIPPGSRLFHHALPVALLPTVTVIALQAGFLIGGAVVTETVFARQGLGRLVVDSVIRQDLPVVQGTVLIGVTGYLVVNLLTDLLYGLLDPRVRNHI